jgi:SAM-dependent methyltransferase
MFQHTRPIIDRASDIASAGGTFDDVLAELRRLSLDDFGDLFARLPHPDMSALSKVLPAMASEQVQRDWTGAAGIDLLKQSTVFIRQVENNCVRYLGKPLHGQRILDFGVGYGRLFRLLYYFSDPSMLWGLDAWQRSLDLCKQAKLPGNFALCGSVPDVLPVGNVRFDAGFAFSVFTHLAPIAAEACLTAIRKAMTPGGIFIATIRNVEVWPHLNQSRGTNAYSVLIDAHNEGRFGYVPHNGPEGETYGDSAVPLSFFDRPGWSLAGYDSSLIDPFQVSVILRAV